MPPVWRGNVAVAVACGAVDERLVVASTLDCRNTETGRFSVERLSVVRPLPVPVECARKLNNSTSLSMAPVPTS